MHYRIRENSVQGFPVWCFCVNGEPVEINKAGGISRVHFSKLDQLLNVLTDLGFTDFELTLLQGEGLAR